MSKSTTKGAPMNSLTIFSRGVAHFHREFELGNEPVTKRISVKTDDLDAIVTTLETFGDVAYVVPPSYSPKNTEQKLSFDSRDGMLSDTLQHLSGSAVEFKVDEKVLKGKLLGPHTSQFMHEGAVYDKLNIVVYGEDNRWHTLPTVDDIRFLEEDVQQEILSALSRNFEKIKPGSTFVELQLSGKEGSLAAVEYMVPAAAWKMCYNLRLNDNGDNRFSGVAIIDNNTDEDWTDFMFNVVNGDPIAYKTDLTQVVATKRVELNVVPRQGVAPKKAPANAAYNYDGPGTLEAAPAMATCSSRSAVGGASPKKKAKSTTSVTSQEVGDFEVFRADKPMTILSKKSALVPMFESNVGEVNKMLWYKHNEHATRPWKSVEFVNNSKHALNQSKVTIYEDGIFAGEAELDSVLRKGEKRILPYGLSNDLKIVRSTEDEGSKFISIKVVDGVAEKKELQGYKSFYHIENFSNEERVLKLDHQNMLEKPTLTYRVSGDDVSPNTTKLERGVRLHLVLNAGDSYTLCVVEKEEMSVQYEVTYSWKDLWAWVETDDKTLQKQLSAAFETIRECTKQVTTLEEKKKVAAVAIENLQSRLTEVRADLSAVGGLKDSDEFKAKIRKWLDRLDETGTEIEARTKEISSLESKLAQVRETRTEAIRNLKF